MKTLLFLNSTEGSQAGIEDGFIHLQNIGEISNLQWFYYEAYSKKLGTEKAQAKMIEIASKIQPAIIIFFHIARFPITKDFIDLFKKIDSNPIIIYDEGDMYGGWAKPMTKSMRIIMKYSDMVSIRGLGKWYNKVKKINPNVVYTPHSDSLFRYSKNVEIKAIRIKKLIFIGNRITSRIGNIRRLHGAFKRERFVSFISSEYPDRMLVYGRGWPKNQQNHGILDFNKQVDICSQYWFHISYEHYPKIPYYFSDRLPIALASGQIYICHYHSGYEQIFKNCPFIYFFKNNQEALDIINYLFSLSDKELYEKSKLAKQYADKYLSPVVIWENLIKNII